ncbi:MFS transporter [Leucobacter allii]|uniref:MFS transporter n=1 Tax=Leucobacter allii TaxID=2932247 RepID=A0ABY4FR50_9MICO|nr:MFS transporter [Leucobacter allii]UOQ58747.1 MFS transporter [Leucobacter allii]
MVSRAQIGFRSERGPILLALMLSTGLIAIDATILATAVQSIVADLGGFSQFPWLFSVYLLAQAVSVPVYAKLADMFGRKPILLLGIALFLIGSIACGLAWSMPALVAFRALQGLGAGAVAPMAQTVVGDIYTLEERAKVQGYIASVWAIASVAGPALGGVFSQFVSWRWIFLVNIPLCLLAGLLILRDYRERLERSERRVDVLGAVVLTAGLVAVILAVIEGGHAWAWLSPQSLGLAAFGIAALAAFVVLSRRAEEPILDLALLRPAVVWVPTCISACVGALLTGITAFAPSYLERAAGATPLVAGFAVAACSLGWPLAASTAGRIYLRWGFRRTALIGSAIATAGAVGLLAVVWRPDPVTIGLCAFGIGFGLGWTATPTLIAAQASVSWSSRGAVTGLNVFARTAGGALGVAIYGAISNTVLAAGRGETDPATVISATSWVFGGAAATAAIMLVAAAAMPRPAASG